MIYRTRAQYGSTGMVVYHGRSYILAAEAWHDATWASERVIEQRGDEREDWQMVVGGYNL